MSPPTFPLRQFLEKLAAGAATLSAETREQARREMAADLNQIVRRLRQSASLDDLADTLGEAAARLGDGAIVFFISDGMATSEKMDLAIPLESAPALAGAMETRDPVTAMATEGEVSALLVERLGHAADGRAHIHPIVVKDSVPAILYAWGDVQVAAVELLAQVAAAVWLGMLPPPPPVVQFTEIAPAPAAKAAASWESLPAEEQQIHLRAQRMARVQAAAMRLEQAAAVQAGRARGNLYEELRGSIDAAREIFRKDFFAVCPSMVDYLHLELVHTLAQDDAELLGKDYPGPMA